MRAALLLLLTVVAALAGGASGPYGDSIPVSAEAGSSYYLYDYMNRPYTLTPEPIWRQIFPGVPARIEAERRAFGVPGQTAREVQYYINAYRKQRATVASGYGK